MKPPRAAKRSLKRYEIANLLFFLAIIVALGVLVSFVFRFYGTRNQTVQGESEMGVISDSVSDTSNVGMFYLGTKLTETSHQYRSRLQIPATDDGLVRDLFALPGVEEVTINQKTILLKKSSAIPWARIQPGVRRIVKEHLHLHY